MRHTARVQWVIAKLRDARPRAAVTILWSCLGVGPLAATYLFAAHPALAAASSGSDPPAATAPLSAAGADISVTGTGDLLVVPDHAVLVILIDSDAASAAAAAADNARRHTAMIAALHAQGATAEDIEDIGYALEPRSQFGSEYNLNGLPTPTGYRASSSIRVQVGELDRLGSWIDAALAAGASRIGQVQFEPKDLAGARQRALALAVDNARADAEALARAAGGSLGPLEELSTLPLGARPTAPLTPFSAAARPGVPPAPQLQTQTQPPELRVEAVVLARWGLRAAARAH